jgi:hypothetical protein
MLMEIVANCAKVAVRPAQRSVSAYVKISYKPSARS